jgi:hypothetical protein
VNLKKIAKHVPFLDMIRQGFFADGPRPSEIPAVNWRRLAYMMFMKIAQARPVAEKRTLG